MKNTLRSRIMLIGKNGQVGWELQRTLMPLGEVVALDQKQLDLTNFDQIRERVREINPSLIVNAAAYTAVDRAEEESELAMVVNAIAPGILAEEARRSGAGIVHYSTDYVFDGKKTIPYIEDDKPNPINEYGRSKLAGEQAIQAVGVPYLILRASWIYGMRGKNFLLTILGLLESGREEIRVVDDQFGAPTWCRMIAEATAQIIAKDTSLFREKGGIYHLSAGGQTSWYEFAKEIMRHASYFMTHTTHLRPISTSEYPTLANRPAYSVLSNTKLEETFKITLPNWEKELELANQERRYKD